MIRIKNICFSDTKAEKPQITEDEDRPFPPDQESTGHAGMPIMQDVPTLMKLKEQTHSHEVDNFKNIVGGISLAICTLIIVAFAIGDAIFEIDSALFTGAFEFSKTIATAII